VATVESCFMNSDLPQALASVLSEMERGRAPYVLYNDPTSRGRVVILVEGQRDATQIAATLKQAGAESSTGRAEDFILRSNASGAENERTYVIELKVATGRSSIANLLWRAAADEGAMSARKSLQRES
jgi:hypothetical protein